MPGRKAEQLAGWPARHQRCTRECVEDHVSRRPVQPCSLAALQQAHSSCTCRLPNSRRLAARRVIICKRFGPAHSTCGGSIPRIERRKSARKRREVARGRSLHECERRCSSGVTHTQLRLRRHHRRARWRPGGLQHVHTCDGPRRRGAMYRRRGQCCTSVSSCPHHVRPCA